MITNETIKTLANKYQTTELNVQREYFQHLFLSYFYQQSEASKIYFKGGTALRILYQSPRFSEDLDFSTAIRSIKIIEQIVIAALAAVEREGIQTDLQEAKTTSGGYLVKMTFKTNSQTISLQLEISLRQGRKQGEVTTVVSDFIPAYTLVHLAQDQLVEEKIKALLDRKKPRDFYDLYFILRSNLLPTKKKDILGRILKTLKQSDIHFARELKQFLPRSHWPVIRSFPAALEREIKRS